MGLTWFFACLPYKGVSFCGTMRKYLWFPQARSLDDGDA